VPDLPGCTHYSLSLGKKAGVRGRERERHCCGSVTLTKDRILSHNPKVLYNL